MAFGSSPFREVFSQDPCLSEFGMMKFRWVAYLSLFTPCLVREESILKDIQPEELHAKIQDPSFIDEAQLIDVREPDEVYVIPHVFRRLGFFLLIFLLKL